MRMALARAKFLNNERGDTIIEVLIATSILSMVLVGAFTIANRNTLATQEVQEHSYAQKVLEGFAEQVKQAGGVPGGCSEGSCSSVVNGEATYERKVSLVSGSTYKLEVTWDTLSGGKASTRSYYTIPPQEFSMTQTPVTDTNPGHGTGPGTGNGSGAGNEIIKTCMTVSTAVECLKVCGEIGFSGSTCMQRCVNNFSEQKCYDACPLSIFSKTFVCKVYCPKSGKTQINIVRDQCGGMYMYENFPRREAHVG